MKNIKSTYLRTNKTKKLVTLFIEHINIGNNFTYDHLIQAINERANYSEDLQEIIEKLNYIDLDYEIRVVANGNFSKVEDTFCLDEFISLIEITHEQHER